MKLRPISTGVATVVVIDVAGAIVTDVANAVAIAVANAIAIAVANYAANTISTDISNVIDTVIDTAIDTDIDAAVDTIVDIVAVAIVEPRVRFPAGATSVCFMHYQLCSGTLPLAPSFVCPSSGIHCLAPPHWAHSSSISLQHWNLTSPPSLILHMVIHHPPTIQFRLFLFQPWKPIR